LKWSTPPARFRHPPDTGKEAATASGKNPQAETGKTAPGTGATGINAIKGDPELFNVYG
jgi:hypothetical protein